MYGRVRSCTLGYGRLRFGTVRYGAVRKLYFMHAAAVLGAVLGPIDLKDNISQFKTCNASCSELRIPPL